MENTHPLSQEDLGAARGYQTHTALRIGHLPSRFQ